MLVLSCLLAAGACPKEPEIVELGTLTISLWTPVGDDYLADASSVTVATTVDGAGATRTFASGEELSLPDLEASAEGSIVSVTVTTDGSTLPDAIARTGEVALAPNGGSVSSVAVLSARGVARRFTDLLPDSRDDAAVCSANDGTILVTGGVRAGSPVAGSVVFDPHSRSLVPGPGQALDAVGSACAILDDGSVLLLAGASADGSGTARLYSAPSARETTAFGTSALTLAAGKRAFGASIVRAGEYVWLLYDDVVERRSVTDLGSVVRTTLSEAHLFGTIAADDVGAVITGGYTDAARTIASSTGHFVSQSGDSVTRPTLHDVQVASFGGRVYALLDDGIVRLTAPAYDLATAERVLDTPTLTRSRARGAFVALDDDVTAFLSADGATLTRAAPNGVATSPLTPAHPGGMLVSGVSGALFVIGGVAGSSVYVADD
jgi:hypothetical protein